MAKYAQWISASMLVAACTGAAFGQAGADIILSDSTNTQKYGPIGGMYAYSIGSNTCNIGSANLTWANGGTPGLAMNVYRINGGRLMQMGLSFVKTACCAAAGGGCPNVTCNGQGGAVLGAGCLDVYGAGWNAGQARLAPRSSMNAFTGQFSTYPNNSGDAIFERAQVRQTDLQVPNSQWLIEGVYVCTEDAQAGNAGNNATYRRVTMSASFDMTVTGVANIGIPAIRAWRDHGLGPNMPDTSVTVSTIDVPGEGRFWYAHKVTALSATGPWRYDYAVFNLNSDKCGGSFSIPVPAGVTISNAGFHAPDYHSGESFVNTDWNVSQAGGAISWSTPQTFAQNPNSSALRWGTMYNFWFEANQPPAQGGGTSATLGLFKPHTTQSVSFPAPGPSAPPCNPDYNQDGAMDNADVFTLASDIAAGASSFPGSSMDFNNDGAPDNSDVMDLAGRVAGGNCP